MSSFEKKGQDLLDVYDAWGDSAAWGARFTEDLEERGPSEEFVFFEGSPLAEVLVVHEQPTGRDTLCGRSYASGAMRDMFHEFLNSVGMDDSDLCFGPLFPFVLRGPEEGKARAMSATEGKVALGYLADVLAVVDPKVVIVLGAKPYNLLRSDKSVSFTRAAKNMHHAKSKITTPGRFIPVEWDAFVTWDFEYLRGRLDYSKGSPLHQSVHTWSKAFAYVQTLHDLLDE